MQILGPVRNNLRLKDSVPITRNTPDSPPPWVVAGQMRLFLEAEDVLLFSSTVETRANMPYATLSAGLIRYTFNSAYVNIADPKDSEGVLARPMGWNIWMEPHYKVDVRNVHFRAPEAGVYVFQHVLYGASSAWTGDPDDKLDIVYVEQYATILRHDNMLAGVLARLAALEAAAQPED